MKKIFAGCLLALLGAAAPKLVAQSAPLNLIQTIPMPGVTGRMDHMIVDLGSSRLFVAGLENGTVEVVDLQSGKWLKSLPGFKKPQGILFVPALNKLFIASGDDGMLRVYNGASFDLLDAIKLEPGPNRVVYDEHKGLVYVGYGGKDAGEDYGVIGVVSAATDKLVSTIRVDAHPAELLLAKSGEQMFVLIPEKSEVQVVDTKSGKVTASWPLSSKSPGDAALDEPAHRLMIGTHTPASMIAMDSTTGKEIATLPTVDGMDGVYYDAGRKRVYVSGGRGYGVGSVFVYQQAGDQYQLLAKVPTKAGSGTSFWAPELNRYYVAAPAHEGDSAAILVFQPQP